jgi:hypothetical protein
MNYLRTAFKIPPASGDNEKFHLLIEAGYEGVSFVYYSKNPSTIQGLFIFHFDKEILADAQADELKHFLQSEELPPYSDCHLCYNYKEFALVPEAMYEEAYNAPILETLFSSNINVSNYSVKVKSLEAMGIYRVNRDVEQVLLSKYPAAKMHHAIAQQIPQLKKKKDLLYVVIYQHTLKAFLFKNEVLQVVQFFEYNSPADVAYHLLNICELHQCSTQEMSLLLSGFVDKKSNLFDELHRYFLFIDVDEPVNDIIVPENIGQYPAHFFSHLIMLVKCVL